MIKITDKATQEIHRARQEGGIPEEQGVRLAPDGAGSLRMVFDTPHTEDVVVRDGESPVLIVDRNVAGHLNSMVLDYEDGASSERNGFCLRQGGEDNGRP